MTEQKKADVEKTIIKMMRDKMVLFRTGLADLVEEGHITEDEAIEIVKKIELAEKSLSEISKYGGNTLEEGRKHWSVRDRVRKKSKEIGRCVCKAEEKCPCEKFIKDRICRCCGEEGGWHSD